MKTIKALARAQYLILRAMGFAYLDHYFKWL